MGLPKFPPKKGCGCYELCRKIKPQRTLEIGLAYGFSTVYFLAAIKANGMGSHVAMDPFETTDWHGIGLKKAQELGMDKSLRFIPEKDVFGLPALAEEGLQFEVIYIDAKHRFDDVLLDLHPVRLRLRYWRLHHSKRFRDAIHQKSGFVHRNNRSDYQRQIHP